MSREQFKRMMDEMDGFKRQITNLNSMVRRRVKKLEKTSDPLERQRIEFEIELLKRVVHFLRIEETKCSLLIIEMMVKALGRKPKDGLDWDKAGRA